MKETVEQHHHPLSNTIAPRFLTSKAMLLTSARLDLSFKALSGETTVKSGKKIRVELS